jgi:hypothetical protein
MTDYLRSAARTLATCVIAAIAVGCTSIPRLDDAKLVSVGVATSADQARLSQAKEQLAREIFGGASIRDPQNGLLVFSSADYDAYRAYKRDHPELNPWSQSLTEWPWPVLRITFSTSRILFEEDDPNGSRQGLLSFCSGSEIGSGDLLWQGRVLTRGIAGQIKAAAAAGPQMYETFVLYTHATDALPNDTAVMLLPPADDLCLSIFTFANWPVGSTTGTSLRIPKNSVAAALGILPRRIAPRSETAP